MNTPTAMTTHEIKEKLEDIVFMVLSHRRSVQPPAEALARYPLEKQQLFIESTKFLDETSTELAFNFCQFAPRALDIIDNNHWHNWIVHLLDLYDAAGVFPAITAMQNVEEYAGKLVTASTGIAFEDVSRVLESFICGLGGRPLKLATSSRTYTDTETLFLPTRIDSQEQREDNFRMYKAMAIHLWAQTWFGSWRQDLQSVISTYPDPARALRLFHTLETLRLDAHISRELPGMGRVLERFNRHSAFPETQVWQHARQRLQHHRATVAESSALLAELYGEAILPETTPYQGELLPECVAAVMTRRLARDKKDLKNFLARLEYELGQQHPDEQPDHIDKARFTINETPDEEMPDGFSIELQYDGVPASPPEDVQQLLDSVLQDLGEIPEEYLVAAGDGQYRPANSNPADDDGATHRQQGAYFYDEWDHHRRSYRKEWCRLRERPINPQSSEFVDQTLRKHRGLLKHLLRTFEALREDDKRLKRQPFGEDIDLDALVESYADTHCGLEASEQLFTKNRKHERNIAVMFMVDMSGSTKGWINDMERESLVLLCEALEVLGDRYAIYGFSGHTHQCCEMFHVKRFDEPYNNDIKARISGIQPQDYTRMGPAIRHLTQILNSVEARTKLLITLSDGRPDDQDGYRGEYGIEDTRKALQETRYLGIHPYCITIDHEALDYLPHMYGAVNFSLINQIDKLPLRVSEIYRRLTM